MEINITCESKEIAALVLAVQERQVSDTEISQSQKERELREISKTINALTDKIFDYCGRW